MSYYTRVGLESDHLYRGPRPTTLEHVLELERLSIRHSINLESGVYKYFHPYSMDIKQIITCSEYDIRMNAILPPNDMQVWAALKLIKNMQLFTKDTESNILVHCRQGVDRTGVVIAAWHVYNSNYTVQEAVNDMYGHGFHRYRYFYWIGRVYQILNDLWYARDTLTREKL